MRILPNDYNPIGFYFLEPLDLDDGEPLALEYPDPDEVLAEIIEELERISDENVHQKLFTLSEPQLEHLLYQVSQMMFNDDKEPGEQCEFYFVAEWKI